MSSDFSISPHAAPRDDAAVRLAEKWVQRREAGLTQGERRELEAWLGSDPAHARAFAALDTRRSVLDWPLQAGVTDEVLAGLQVRARRRRARRQVIGSLAAAAVIAIGFFLGRYFSASVAPIENSMAAIKVLQPSTQTLPDGSEVELKGGAQIETDFTGNERRVVLTQGTAHFTVAKNPQRPFIVTAGRISVRAVGTAFSVEFAPRDVTVLVTEGRVTVAPAGATAQDAGHSVPASTELLTTVDAGSGVVVSTADNAGQPVALTEIEDRLVWRIPRLEFSGMALGEVVRTLNRYNRVQLVLADSSLEKLEVSGALRADKVGALVAMLEADFKLGAERRDDSTIVLRESR